MFPANGRACAKRQETQVAQGVGSIDFEVGQRCADLEKQGCHSHEAVVGGRGRREAARPGMQ